MSILNELIKKADNNNGYASITGFSDSILHSIEVGTREGHYYAYKEEKRPRKIEVWLHFNRPISADECKEFECILQENDIPDHDIFYNGKYDYHLPFFSVAWLADIFPKLLATKLPTTKQPVEQMLESALKSGCDVLDMSTMTIYSTRK